MSVVFLRCRECAVKVRWTNYTPGDPIPDCPNCGTTAAEDKLDFRKPIRIKQGGSSIGRAVQIAHEVAEKDYGLTDMRDKTDPGETVAPKLTKDQQIMDRAWKNAGKFQAPQRFPGLTAGQGWMDAARAASASSAGQDVAAVTNVFSGLKNRKLAVDTIDRDGGSPVMRRRLK